MYDDPTLYAYQQGVQTQEEKPYQPKHRRKPSLLDKPNENDQANKNLADVKVIPETEYSRIVGPPKATLSRRAQSYTDFHYAARAVLRPKSPLKDGDLQKNGEEIKIDIALNDWYQVLEGGLLESSHDQYKAYQDQLRFTESYLDSLSSDTSSTLDILASLSKSFRTVETQTTAFQQQCESLTLQQKRLMILAEGVGRNLQYYSFLDPITRRLNAPGAGNFFRGQEFSDMLARLDECLDYMNAHQSQREAPTYRSRYRLLLTRGLTLIRVHFGGALKDISQDVTKRIADKQLNDTTMSALLYAKFRVGAAELKKVAEEIRKRTRLPAGAEPGAEAEYQSLMKELYSSYSATRGRLVIPLVRKKLGEIAMAPSTSKDLVAFARSSIGHIQGICADEYELWCEWFEGEDGLYDFLELICEPLYDQLTPRTVHESQLLKLCELCTLIQTRYMRDQDEELEALEIKQLDFSILIQRALEDAQTRLVFRTQAILRDEIENYRPKSDDLNYPAQNRRVSLTPDTKSNGPVTSGRKASLARKSLPPPKTPEAADGIDPPNEQYGFNLEGASQGWYPTLRKAIWLLSRIYRLVNSTVFDDLAHQIVHQTTLSLHRAASILASKASVIDSQLFLLKHLLILKQQIVAFDIEYVTPDISFDFSGVTNTFYELRDRGGLFDPRNLWRFMGGSLLPRVVENMLDAKAELDGRLRTVINGFTTTLAKSITAPINDPGKRGFDAGIAIPQIQQLAEREVTLLRRKLDEYLDDARTKETLVSAVQDQVIQIYETFFERLAAEKRANGKAVSTKGKGREGEAWDVKFFTERIEVIFAVRTFGFVGEEKNGRSRSRSFSGSRSV